MPSLDKLSPLPGPGDPYKAFARPSHQMLTTLFVIRGDEKRGFPFGDLDGPDMLPGESANQGPVIVMRFARIFPTEVILIGRNLDELYNYLGDHRIRWVRCLPEGKMIKDRDVPVITEIVVRPLKRPDDEE